MIALLILILMIRFFCPLSILAQGTTGHEKIPIRGFDGQVLTAESKEPYSPKRTCGPCHDYRRITNGYHFQQGRTDAAGTIVISDQYDSKFSWNLSAGMYGKHHPASYDSDQLSRKTNGSPSEIDMSSFSFVQGCGSCHPGGGPGEYDRRGNLYFNQEPAGVTENRSGEARLDGDYTPFSKGESHAESSWETSGPSEADCLICHLKTYRWKDRAAALKLGFFRFGPSIGAGWATLRISEDRDAKADGVAVDYSKKEVADFEDLHLQIIKRVPDENCWSCHAAPDGKRKGQQWGPDSDVHKAKSLDCLSCHPGNKEHNFAKGETVHQTVRDDLNNTMRSCEDCHYRGKDRRAPRYRHPFSPRHMKRLSCQLCHIPYQTSSSDLVYDHASTGSTVVYETSKFLSSDPLDPRKPSSGTDANLWYPAVKEFRGRIVPVKSVVVIYWGDLDEKTKVVKPIPLWKIRELRKTPSKEEKPPEARVSPEEIKTFLKLLRGRDRLGSLIAHHPVLMKGGFLYDLDKKGELEKVKHEQAGFLDLSLSHNVAAGSKVIGAGGCRDCHSQKSPFFLRKILVDPFGEKGNPAYTEVWERLGIDRDKLSRLLEEQ
jgi:hypothetical protein